ncbi:MAG: putative N-acetylmannosamine-6-phosphate 2-epimerase [Pseudomonadota bacterium]
MSAAQRRLGRLAALDAALRGRLVVSVPPVDAGPLDDDATVVRMARAALAGGAAGLRIEGASRLAAVRAAVTVPLIGIVKHDLPASPVRITPRLEDVHALVAAGADLVALDSTERPRPVPLAALLSAVHAAGLPAMADASCAADARAAMALGFEVVGSTLSGYTGGPVPDEPDLHLVRELARAGCRVVAEGRYHRPEQAAAAIAAGAWCVTVGSALTRLEHATGWFAAAVAAAAVPTARTPGFPAPGQTR